MKTLFRGMCKAAAWIVCRIFPVNSGKIVISSYYGRGYGDNLKYIAEKLLASGEDLKIVWLVKDEREKKSLPAEIIGCKVNSAGAIYHLSTAKIWIDNCRKGMTLFKRKKQFYIQTWHGGGAQKRCEADAESVLSKKYVRSAKKDSKMIDLFISDSRFMTDLFHRSFWYGGPVLECGYPRYDVLLSKDEELVSKVYGYYNIDREKKLVLYAPTFRVDLSFDAYNIDFARLRESLKKRFGEEFVILVHLHPNVANVEGGIEYDGVSVINSTFYPDTQELIAVSHILIGDYSSINYDFSLKREPVFRYTADLADYCNDRDLYFAFGEYPYPYAENNDELEKLVLDFNEEEYLNTLNAFFERLGAVIRDDSSDKVAGAIIEYLKSKNKKEFFEKNKDRFVY